ncbi:NADPH:quinone oxidoreductase family protein [Neotabrizicola sp. sgz301269]|uniref:NADPH:quinone oxidoreductase family protein n=1 Tax=Neotabrizicola sp. sgz301269 TaxID=3276282 RepID=UPI00376FE2EF
MQAWTVAKLYAQPEITAIPCPEPGRGEVLLRVAAAGLNFADLLMLQGRYQTRPAPPFVPGLELAGTVMRVGPETMAPPAGTRVAAYAGLGAFAEYAVVPVDRLLPLPAAMPFSIAAGFQIAYGTSHLGLTHLARLQANETLFVTGAAGGVGLTAVEIGRLLGARVIASVRGPEKAEIARKAGAETVIDSEAHPGGEGLKDALRALGGLDVTYDTVGGPGFDAALRATRPGGRMLAIGFAGGEVPQVPLNQLLVRNVTIAGLWWGAYADFAPVVMTDSLAQLIRWWEDGRLAPHVSHILPFDRLPEGLALLRDRAATGKIVLRVDHQQE